VFGVADSPMSQPPSTLFDLIIGFRGTSLAAVDEEGVTL
jgi:hypothetical protein